MATDTENWSAVKRIPPGVGGKGGHRDIGGKKAPERKCNAGIFHE